MPGNQDRAHAMNLNARSSIVNNAISQSTIATTTLRLRDAHRPMRDLRHFTPHDPHEDAQTYRRRQGDQPRPNTNYHK